MQEWPIRNSPSEIRLQFRCIDNEYTGEHEYFFSQNKRLNFAISNYNRKNTYVPRKTN